MSVESQSSRDLVFVEKIDRIKAKLREMNIVFKRQYIIGIPMVGVAKSWHYFNRVRQFTYRKS